MMLYIRGSLISRREVGSYVSFLIENLFTLNEIFISNTDEYPKITTLSHSKSILTL